MLLDGEGVSAPAPGSRPTTPLVLSKVHPALDKATQRQMAFRSSQLHIRLELCSLSALHRKGWRNGDRISGTGKTPPPTADLRTGPHRASFHGS